ncbi:MAG TPA: hypothetical protein VHB98_22495 [Chloroflexota bacterium]|nr:hypothetical protein [Chloroflexota bacterium]
MQRVVLAATLHDPADRLYAQTVRVLPALVDRFAGLAVDASAEVGPRTIALLQHAGAHVRQRASDAPGGLAALGGPRRSCVEMALHMDATAVLYCDFDRALHWAEQYPDELARVLTRLADHDCTVLGRTPRAFAAHPRVQRDTEAIINQVFALVSDLAWSDVTGAARGLSPRAAQAILDGCPDQAISTDVSWPLFLQRAGGFSLGYLATEGLEFETADRYGDEVAAAGGLERWIARIDADPRQWAFRLELARIEVAAALQYAAPS